VLQTAVSDVPRFDHNPTTCESLGLMVEEQRTNLLLRSAEFNDATWEKSAVTVTANSVTSPDGTSSADTLDDGLTANFHHVSQTVTTTASAAYTFSAYFKNVDRRYVILSVYSTSTSVLYAAASFDLQNGVLASSGASGTGYAVTSTSITSVGNGWYRCSVSITNGSASAANTISIAGSDTGTLGSYGLASYTGSSKTFYVYGAQLEAGSFATSYIPTTSATVTRSADVAQVSTQAFPYSQTEGTLVAQFSMFSATGAATRAITIASDGTSANRIYLNVSTTGVPNYLVVSSTATQASINATEITSNSINRFAAAYKTNDFASCLNGGTVGTDTLGSSPTGVFRLDLGNFVGGNQINGHIRQITYIPRRLTNAELQQRSS
jgi:hypothetical protein